VFGSALADGKMGRLKAVREPRHMHKSSSAAARGAAHFADDRMQILILNCAARPSAGVVEEAGRKGLGLEEALVRAKGQQALLLRVCPLTTAVQVVLRCVRERASVYVCGVPWRTDPAAMLALSKRPLAVQG
jgi:hypothetical protein